MRTLLIDNYDSFTYNLHALLTEVNGEEPVVVANDAPWSSVNLAAFDNVVVSPVRGVPTAPATSGSAGGPSPTADFPCSECAWGTKGCVTCSEVRWSRRRSLGTDGSARSTTTVRACSLAFRLRFGR